MKACQETGYKSLSSSEVTIVTDLLWKQISLLSDWTNWWVLMPLQIPTNGKVRGNAVQNCMISHVVYHPCYSHWWLYLSEYPVDICEDILMEHCLLVSAFEKNVVPWAPDSDVNICTSCGKSFTITRRRHHCRLCGTIICNKCSQFLPYGLASRFYTLLLYARLMLINLLTHRDCVCDN